MAITGGCCRTPGNGRELRRELHLLNRRQRQRLVIGVDLQRLQKAVPDEQQEATHFVTGCVPHAALCWCRAGRSRAGRAALGEQVDGSAATGAARSRKEALRLFTKALDTWELWREHCVYECLLISRQRSGVREGPR